MPGNVFHSSHCFSANARRGFTLAEMLVVMGVIGILLVVTLPAFKGMNQGGSRRGAVSALMGTLDHARMMAVSDGLPTYVVLACKSDGPTQTNPNLWGRAYAIYQDVDNVNFRLAQRTPWVQLPENVAFKVDKNTGPLCVTSQPLTIAGPSADPAFPVSAAAVPPGSKTTAGYEVQLPYWKFTTTGAVDDGVLNKLGIDRNVYLRLLLFTGHVDAAGKEISTQNNGGRGNQTATLLEEIDLNPVTGRARYVVDSNNNLATPTPSPGT